MARGGAAGLQVAHLRIPQGAKGADALNGRTESGIFDSVQRADGALELAEAGVRTGGGPGRDSPAAPVAPTYTRVW